MKHLSIKNKKVLRKIVDENKLENYDSMSYSELMKTYHNINKIFKENGLDIYEINSIINSKKLNNKDVELVKKFIYKKNKSVLKQSSRTDMWKKNINNIIKYCNGYNIKSSYDTVEDAFIKTTKKFTTNWLGYWSIIEVSKTGKIKKIDLFDVNDLNQIINQLKN
jgi:hypothetical protein